MSIEGDCVGRTLADGVGSARQRARQDVVGVGGDDQPLDRQAHALGDRTRRKYRRNCLSA